jgi:hypothetical protein
VATEVTDRAEYDAAPPDLIRALGIVGRAAVPDVVGAGGGGTDRWFGTLPLVRIRPAAVLPGPWDPGGRGWLGMAAVELSVAAILVALIRSRRARS